METRVPVKEIMTRDVKSISQNKNARKASEIMLEENVGSLVVLDEIDNPIGILTEKDLVRKVISKNKSPSEVIVNEIMTKPLVTIPPNTDLNEAVRKMSDLNIKKFPVVKDNELLGIVTENDVLAVSPALNEILEEIARINQDTGPTAEESWTDTGICQNCGTYSKNLTEVGGNLICEKCREEL
ncbi:hypothetical protein C9439_05965 [archaeon SCG-AAA382B04]|nr:hypothetical protein C9439_05965 [archaeon SCG-AAA382B04]